VLSGFSRHLFTFYKPFGVFQLNLGGETGCVAAKLHN